MNWTTSRRETGLIEHTCEHGTSHPNRGSALWLAEHFAEQGETGGRQNEGGWLLHGCCEDICCARDDFPGTVERALAHSHKLVRGWKTRFKTEQKDAASMRSRNALLLTELAAVVPVVLPELPKLSRNSIRPPTPRETFFLDMAESYAELRSDNPGTKTGCVIQGGTSHDKVISMGANRLPDGLVKPLPGWNWRTLLEKPQRDMALLHAEEDAILRASESVRGATMYMPWFPCALCARVIVLSGIGRLVCTEPNYKLKRAGADFTNSWRVAEALFETSQMDVQIVEYEGAY